MSATMLAMGEPAQNVVLVLAVPVLISAAAMSIVGIVSKIEKPKNHIEQYAIMEPSHADELFLRIASKAPLERFLLLQVYLLKYKEMSGRWRIALEVERLRQDLFVNYGEDDASYEKELDCGCTATCLGTCGRSGW